MTMNNNSLNGPLTYLGVRAATPPNLSRFDRAPLTSDYKSWVIGDIWLQADTENIWVLTDKKAGIATWTMISYNLPLIPYPSTLRTLADGTVYGLPDGAAPGLNEGNVYHINSSGVAQWGDLTSTGGTVTITTSINGINLEAAGGSSASIFTTDDGNSAVPTAGGNVYVDGGDNINTTSTIANTFTINLDTSIHQPATNASGTEGLYTLDGDDFMHAYGTGNTFLGEDAGSRTLISSSETVAIGTESLWNITTGDSNTGVGYNSATEVTTGSSNCSFGASSLLLLESGDENCSFGDLSLSGIVTGDNNIAIGSQAGGAHTLADSSNIDIGSAGVLGGNNTIRIGTQGSGAGQQNAAFMAGIYNTTVSGNRLVQVDSNGQLGQTEISAGTGISITNVGGSLTVTNTSPGGNCLAWSEISTPTHNMAVNNGYISINGAITEYTLPAVASIGDRFAITATDSTRWRLIKNAGQNIMLGAFDVSDGYPSDLESYDPGSYIELLCTEANTTFRATIRKGSCNYVTEPSLVLRGILSDYYTKDQRVNGIRVYGSLRYYSTNEIYGEDWYYLGTGAAHVGKCIAYGQGIYVGNSVSNQLYYLDHIGGAWAASLNVDATDITYGNGYWIAVRTGSDGFYYSTDPTSGWTFIDPGVGNPEYTCYANGWFLVCGTAGCFYTKDPVGSWTAIGFDGSYCNYINGVWYILTYSKSSVRYMEDKDVDAGSWTTFTPGGVSFYRPQYYPESGDVLIPFKESSTGYYKSYIARVGIVPTGRF